MGASVRAASSAVSTRTPVHVRLFCEQRRELRLDLGYSLPAPALGYGGAVVLGAALVLSLVRAVPAKSHLEQHPEPRSSVFNGTLGAIHALGAHVSYRLGHVGIEPAEWRVVLMNGWIQWLVW